MDFCMVYITCKDTEEADSIAHHLLERHLVACANIYPIRSLYWWKGEIQREGEVAVIMKTRCDNREQIIKEVLAIHSYEVPCVEFISIKDGNPGYLEWIGKETSGE